MKMWRFLGCGLLVGGLAACGSDPSSGGGRVGPGFAGTGGAGAGAGGTAGSPTGGASGFGNSNGGTGGMVAAGAGGIGGAAGGNPDECSGVSETAMNMVQPVDIIIGVDTSGSMGEEIAFVQQNLNAFSQQIISSGIDVRVIMLATEGVASNSTGSNCLFPPPIPCVSIGGDFGVCIDPPLGSGQCPADSNPPTYQHVLAPVGSNDVLNVFISAYALYKPYLRPGSLKTFLSITDDDATDFPYNNADAFIAAVAALDPDPSMWASWKYSSIYCFTNCPAAASIGAVHADLVTKTGGIGGDLCLQDFAPVFNDLATDVTESVSLACEWAIPPVPDGETFDPNKTNVSLTLAGANEALPRVPEAGDCADLAAWHYDDASNPTKVLACPSVCERIQAANDAAVDIVFGCATIDVPVE